ncbi:YjzC family protein [Clostridium estertheticum]|uniref:YjzC family protein n=1 Tax=Clostridium estertheticum TaxID=238834 RepID=UPI00124C8ADC|nr:YjzC family protein [Clostridium estertheticum]MBZ9615279.1 YjzC family protein [Clostridium estertheticum subsp. laramiense]WAG75168.1 YjzC family protein [Clostridium estertheticum]
MSNSNIKPGTHAPKSGQYVVVEASGKVTTKKVTAVKGNPMPPTSKPNQTYTLVDGTNNKSGK